jgi:hypothetical protein
MQNESGVPKEHDIYRTYGPAKPMLREYLEGRQLVVLERPWTEGHLLLVVLDCGINRPEVQSAW